MQEVNVENYKKINFDEQDFTWRGGHISLLWQPDSCRKSGSLARESSPQSLLVKSIWSLNYALQINVNTNMYILIYWTFSSVISKLNPPSSKNLRRYSSIRIFT